MDHNSIIDRQTFEVCTHSEDHPNVFICDKQIANAVAILNKKGYKTFASCGGHYRIEFYEYFNEDLSKLEEMKKDDRVIIKNVREDSFDFWWEVDKTTIYILFDKIYKFDTLPNGFKLENSNNKTDISCMICYYDENNKKKTRKDVEEEIEKNCKILEKWANDLPNRKER